MRSLTFGKVTELKVAILTSPNQWFEPYASDLAKRLRGAPILTDHQNLSCGYDVVFILAYHRILSTEVLSKNQYNIVIHESDLPKGKGWAPLFWQVLEGKNEITFSMIEASGRPDAGDVYMKRTLYLSGNELNPELRRKQAELSIKMCLEFIDNIEAYLPPEKQNGPESFYPKRNPSHSQLDINKTIKDQFNLLRIVDNDHYPAFFEIGGKKYIIKITEAD